jgi:methylenetetrahydrofolate reductase (NADPH)
MTKVSFEFFPPRDLPASFKLWEAVNTLTPFYPEFVSVTYGAGGTTRTLTHQAVDALQTTQTANVAAHLTCVGASKAETLQIAQDYAKSGVRDIVALRGDAPKGKAFTAHPEGFQSSVDLIEGLRMVEDFNIYVGAYPETHPEAASGHADVACLKAKLDAGAMAAITQFFFEADTFFRFRDRCVAAGITAPIIPGILPVQSWNGVQKFAKSCGAHIPQVLQAGFSNAQRDGTHELLAQAHATELCDELIQGGVDHLHFYTLNSANLTRDVCHALGFTAQTALRDVA